MTKTLQFFLISFLVTGCGGHFSSGEFSNAALRETFESIGDKPTVFLFVKTDCPISNRYAPTCRALFEKFSSRGVQFLLIYPDPAENEEVVAKHRSDFGYPMEGLRDPDHELVDFSEVQVTPEAAVFQRDPSGEIRLVYRGAIDNRFVDFGKQRAEASEHYLEQVVESALANQPIEIQATKAVGCLIADFK